MAAHQLTLCQKYEDIEGLILLWGSSLPMQLNLSFILLLTPRQNPPSDSPALVSHLLPFIVIGRPPYSKEGQCLANSPTDMPVGELAKHRHGQNASRGNNTGYIAMLSGFSSYNEEHPIHQGEGVWIDTSGKDSNKYSANCQAKCNTFEK